MILKIILNLDEKWCSMVSILFNGTSEKYYNGTKVFFLDLYIWDMGVYCIWKWLFIFFFQQTLILYIRNYMVLFKIKASAVCIKISTLDLVDKASTVGRSNFF